MRWAFSIVIAFLLVIPLASSLESGTIFSVQPGGGYKCVYVSLPQDLGLSTVSDTSKTTIEVDKGESPWADMTYSEIVMEPGVLSKSPVCFYYSDKEEGEFSFYKIKLSSRDLGVSSSIAGGLCVSDYEDVDTGVNTTEGTDICKLLNENADIIDLTFKEEVTQANPGDTVTKMLYITSYANLRIKLSIATNLENDFGSPVVTTSPTKPTAIKTFNVNVPEREGEFEMLVNAQAVGCGIQACKKQEKTSISVSDKEKEGFSVSVVPKNINIKEAGEVLFRIVISNYEETQDFVIEASSDPELTLDPETKTVNVEKDDEKTTVFKAITGEEDLYGLEFKITTEKSEKLLITHISIGELLTDAYRYAEDAEKTSTPDIREEIRKAKEEYESKYETTSYGDDVDDYEDFIETIDELKETPVNGGNGKEEPEPQEQGFNWLFLAIPVIIIVVVILLFVAYKKSKVTESGYKGYEYSRF